MAFTRRAIMAQRGSLRLPTMSPAVAAIGPVASRVTTIEDHITIVQTPTITAGAYTIGDAVGGLLTFADAALGNGREGEISTLIIVDRGQQEAAFDLVLFDGTFTATADNAVFDPSDADLANTIGMIPVLPEHYTRFFDNSMAMIRPVGLYFTTGANANIYGQLVVRGIPTYASVGDLTVKLTVKRN